MIVFVLMVLPATSWAVLGRKLASNVLHPIAQSSTPSPALPFVIVRGQRLQLCSRQTNKSAPLVASHKQHPMILQVRLTSCKELLGTA